MTDLNDKRPFRSEFCGADGKLQWRIFDAGGNAFCYAATESQAASVIKSLNDATPAPQAAPSGLADAVAAMQRAKKLPVWDAIDHRLHVELDTIFKVLSAPASLTPAPQGTASEPVTYLRWWARQINEGHGNIGHEEGYEVCERGEMSDDGTPSFPVYAEPPAASLTQAATSEPVTIYQIEQDDGDWCDVQKDFWGTMPLERRRIVYTAKVAQSTNSTPVAWSRTCAITDDQGYAIGMDEPEVQWGKEKPEDDWEGGWFPLYSTPPAAPAAAHPAPSDALATALSDLIEVAERCDSWESFPSAALEKARAALSAQQAGVQEAPRDEADKKGGAA